MSLIPRNASALCGVTAGIAGCIVKFSGVTTKRITWLKPAVRYRGAALLAMDDKADYISWCYANVELMIL